MNKISKNVSYVNYYLSLYTTYIYRSIHHADINLLRIIDEVRCTISVL